MTTSNKKAIKLMNMDEKVSKHTANFIQQHIKRIHHEPDGSYP